MKKGIKVWGRRVPVWLLVLALIAAGAGAATGTVLAAKITAKVPVTVSQALLLDMDGTPANPIVISGADNAIGAPSDDGAGFTAGMELNNADTATINVYLKNHAAADLHGKLTLWNVPKGITLSVSATDGDSDGNAIVNVTRVGKYEWLFLVENGVGGQDYLTITVALAVNMKPGFYEIKGKIEPVNY